mmetsp:Transcript_8829/g.21492  ORF Transcript_8829/g.21492 Transcript_8829/m.21492 type:complete len:1020 (+) Transcript_8829:300-3359(+)
MFSPPLLRRSKRLQEKAQKAASQEAARSQRSRLAEDQNDNYNDQHQSTTRQEQQQSPHHLLRQATFRSDKMGELPHEKRMSDANLPQPKSNGGAGGITSGAATSGAEGLPPASGNTRAVEPQGTVRKSGSGKTMSGLPAKYDDTVKKYCSQLMQVVAGKPHYYSLFKVCVGQQKPITVKGNQFGTEMLKLFVEGYNPHAHVLFEEIRNPYIKDPLPEAVINARKKLGIRSTPASVRRGEPEALAEDPTAAAPGSVGGSGTYPGGGVQPVNMKKLLKRQKSGAAIDLAAGSESSSPSLIEMEPPALKRPKPNEKTVPRGAAAAGRGTNRAPSPGLNSNFNPRAASGGRARSENKSPRDGTKGRPNAFERNNSHFERTNSNDPPAPPASEPAAQQPPGAPLGANLQKVSEYKAFFTEHSIPFAHCIEKQDFGALKSEFDALCAELKSVGAAAKKLQERHKPVTLNIPAPPGLSGAGGSSSSSSSARSANQPGPGGNSGTSARAHPTHYDFETDEARQERLADAKSRNRIFNRPGGPPTMHTSRAHPTAVPAFQPAQRAGGVGVPAAAPLMNKEPPPSTKELELIKEAGSIMKIRELGRWAYDLLGISFRTAELSDVNAKWRLLMKKFHPDKLVGTSGKHKELFSQVVEKAKRAKTVAEDEIGRKSHDAPDMIRGIRTACLDDTRGKRVFKITWTAPKFDTECPIEKYHLQVFDPRYGKFLTLSVLEGDYDEDEKRFIKIEEQNFFKMQESEMGKLAHIFCEDEVKIQVCAQNRIGCGPYAQYSFRTAMKTAASRNTAKRMEMISLPAREDFTANLRSKKLTPATAAAGPAASTFIADPFGLRGGAAASSTSSRAPQQLHKAPQLGNPGPRTHSNFVPGQFRAQMQNRIPDTSVGHNTGNQQPRQPGIEAANRAISRRREENFGFKQPEVPSAGLSQTSAAASSSTAALKEQRKVEQFRAAMRTAFIGSDDGVRKRWLDRQPKEHKRLYLKSVKWPTMGQDDELDQRILTYTKLRLNADQTF